MPLLDRRRSEADLFIRTHVIPFEEADFIGRAEVLRPGTASLASPRPSSSSPIVARSPPLGSDPGSPGPRNFSMRLSRHFSEGELGMAARQYTEREGPIPLLQIMSPQPLAKATGFPTIISPPPQPPVDPAQEQGRKKSRGGLFKRQKSMKDEGITGRRSPAKKEEPKSRFTWGRKSFETRRTTEDDRRSMHDRRSTQNSPHPPSPPLIPPQALHERLSFVAGGDATPQAAKKSGLFTMSKRDKRKSLFPLPPKVDPSSQPQYPDTAPATPRGSTSAMSQQSASERDVATARQSMFKPNEHTNEQDSHMLRSSLSQQALPKSSVSFAPPGYPLTRNDSNISAPSTNSSPALGPPRRLGIRERASTNSTFGRQSEDIGPPTPPTLNGSVRNSSSTGGRASLGGYLTLNRFRGEGSGLRHDSPGGSSKQNSLTISRGDMALPPRQDGETAAKYLERLQGLASRNVIAGVLSKSSDPFFQTVLRSYTRRFAFFGEPIDMSLRKFLLEAELPKETQQVDRVIQAFADRYHECNPGIFVGPDSAYIVAFSLMMLHTDAFNKNNKHKMGKGDYIKNTRGQSVSEDVLACFYDNICYTPFIHFDEDDFGSSDRLSSFKSKKTKLKGAMPDQGKKSSGPVDPYYLIIENKLDALRPSIRESIVLEDPYSSSPPGKPLDAERLQMKFKFGGVIQIISARSRPAAFESHSNGHNPDDSRPGVVDLQVTKVGILWRKAAKRKKTRSPWQEWGAMLTGSQLYFFKNVSWIKSLMQQYNTHQKHMVPPSSIVFKPPLEDFKPDSLVRIDDTVALLDSTYSKHKHAFTLIRQSGEEEVLLADTENELTEWIAMINYAAAFRTAGVRIRGYFNVNTMSPRRTTLPASGSARNLQDHNRQGSIDPTMAMQIMAARRKQMVAKLAEAEIKLLEENKKLDDMLRNARHLQILAPIQPRSREVVIHSAAKMDAMLKWIRRDIWRTKCYKEILFADAAQDDSAIRAEAERMRPVSSFPMLEDEIEIAAVPAEDEDDENESESAHDSSATASRPATTSTLAQVLNDDVFQTPAETRLVNGGDTWSWKLPPVELHGDSSHSAALAPETHSSASSIVPSDHSARRASITHGSVASTAADPTRLSTTTASDVNRTLSTTSTSNGPLTPAGNSRREPLDQTLSSSTAPHSSRRTSVTDPLAVHVTPDSSGKIRPHRRSLHRTLRDGLHDPTGSIHRHRKGKGSASTVRSDGGLEAAEAEDTVDGTPGLERSKGRFILHGKQASVITFGEGLDGAAMRMSSVSSRRRVARGASLSHAGGRRSFSDSVDGLGILDGATDSSVDGGSRRPSRQRSRTQSSSTETRSELWSSRGAAQRSGGASRERHGMISDARVAAAFVADGLTGSTNADGGELTPKRSMDSSGTDAEDERQRQRHSFAREDSGGEFFDAPDDESTELAHVAGGRGASRWVGAGGKEVIVEKGEVEGGSDEDSDSDGAAGEATPHIGYRKEQHAESGAGSSSAEESEDEDDGRGRFRVRGVQPVELPA